MITHLDELSRRDVLRLLGVGIGTAGVGGFTGCTRSGGAAPADGDRSSTTFSLTSYMASEDANKPFFKHLIDSYQDSHDVAVELVAYPFDAYTQPVLLRARSGEVHGAAQISIADVATFAAAGVIEDLTEIAAKHDYTQVGLDGCSVDGKPYALPWAIDSIGLVTNTQLLDRAGVEIPTTIDEFEQALLKLKKIKGVTPYAGATKGDSIKDVFQWMKTFGASVFQDGAVTIGDAASVEALDWYKSLVDRKLVALDVDRPDMRVLYGRGTAGFYEDAVQARAFAQALPDADKTIVESTAPLSRPVLQRGDPPRALLHGCGLMIFAGEAADSAIEFAEYATTDEAMLEEFLDVTGLPPATESGLSSPMVTDSEYQKMWSDKITATAESSPFWQFPQYSAIQKTFDDAVTSVLTGQTDTKSALTAAADAMQKLVDK